MAMNHVPYIRVITETRVGGDKAAKIIEDLPFDIFMPPSRYVILT